MCAKTCLLFVAKLIVVLGVTVAQSDRTGNELQATISNRTRPPPDCNNALYERYRAADGSCNTPLRDARLGMANTSFFNLIPLDSQKPTSPQPTAKDVSAVIFTQEGKEQVTGNNFNISLMSTYWGQFIGHDLTRAATVTSKNGTDVSTDWHGFSAAAEAATKTYIFNTATHYLDGSMVYGSSDQLQHQLRSHQGGRLKVSREDGRDVLPLGPDKPCAPKSGGCFIAGDPRVNQVLPLTALHMLFLREHNRVAGVLSSLHPDWNDEKLFQEARLIVIAEIQHITYNEWLADVVGPIALNLLNKYKQNGFAPRSELYNPVISSEFVSAAFRYGHSTVVNQMDLPPAGPKDQKTEVLNVMDFYYRCGRIRENGFFDRMLRSTMETKMHKVSRIMPDDLHGRSMGFDLAALSIQRCRDYKLRRYVDYLKWSGRRSVTSWADLKGVMESDMVTVLQKVYKTPEEVDLYVGGLLEKPAPQAVVGPTFQALIMEQFQRTMLADRMFYLHSKALSTAQIQEIRKTSLARLICDNSDNIQLIAKNVFQVPHNRSNPKLSCNKISSVNLTLWK